MRKTTKSPGEKIVKDIKRATRKHYSSAPLFYKIYIRTMFKSKQLLPAIGVNMGGMRTFAATAFLSCHTAGS